MLRKIIAGSLVAIVLLAGVSAGLIYRWQEGRLSTPAPGATAALRSNDQVEVTVADWITFAPRNRPVRMGVVFYPGAHCDPRGYAPLMRKLATEGYLTIAVSMPLYLAFLAPDRANDVMGAFPGVQRWVIAGHSLGGAMAAQFAREKPNAVDGLIIWDSYPIESGSLVDYPRPVLLVHRASEAGVAPESYRASFHRFPQQTRFVAIKGGNHMNFGDFILGPGRSILPATISASEQHQLIVSATLAWLEEIAEGR